MASEGPVTAGLSALEPMGRRVIAQRQREPRGERGVPARQLTQHMPRARPPGGPEVGQRAVLVEDDGADHGAAHSARSGFGEALPLRPAPARRPRLGFRTEPPLAAATG